MARQQVFSEEVVEKLGNYVYRLIDPRNGSTFYVGRGRGNRVFAHAAGQAQPTADEDTETLKLRTIRAIRNAGFEVQHVVHRHGMDEATAREVEAALIDAYPGLTNIQGGYEGNRGIMHADEVIRLYAAPEAQFRHSVMLINVNRSSEDQDVYDAVRYSWKVSPRKARKAEYVLAVRRGLIIGVFIAEQWMEGTKENFPSMNRDGYGPREGRWGFVGHEAPDDIRKMYMHTRVPDEHRKQGAANPIRYVGPAFD